MYPGTWAEARPEHAAIVMAGTDTVVTYAELDAASNRLAHAMRAHGLRRGDHIAVFMENRPEFFEVAWAGLRSGLYVTLVNSFLSAEEAAYIVDDCEARFLITSATKADVASDLAALTPRVERRLMVGGAIDSYESYEALVASQPSHRIDDESLGDTMLYSSGTTGRPKGVVRPLPEVTPWHLTPHEQQAQLAEQRERRYGIDADTVYLSPAPLYHTAPFGYCVRVHVAGGTVVVMDRFEPLPALEYIDRYRITHSQWVPTMFSRMLKLPDTDRLAYDLSSHRAAIHAAAPCPVEVKQAMMEWWGPIIHEYYAGTEGIGGTRIGPEEWLEHPGSVGPAGSGDVFILDADGNELPVGESGAIWFRATETFAYKGDPAKTQEATSEKGLGTYGDVGYVDDRGYLFLTDRKSHMIISGGVNIYPREAEDVLIAHPKVADVAVFGVPNEDLGEEVKAVVQVAEGVSPSGELEAELMAYCSDRIARYKCPRSVDFADDLPRLPTGKLYKRKLRDEYWADRG